MTPAQEMIATVIVGILGGGGLLELIKYLFQRYDEKKKKYTVKNNKKGKATFKVKLTKKGTFKYTVKFAGDSQYKAVKKSAKIKIK